MRSSWPTFSSSVWVMVLTIGMSSSIAACSLIFPNTCWKKLPEAISHEKAVEVAREFLKSLQISDLGNGSRQQQRFYHDFNKADITDVFLQRLATAELEGFNVVCNSPYLSVRTDDIAAQAHIVQIQERRNYAGGQQILGVTISIDYCGKVKSYTAFRAQFPGTSCLPAAR